MSRHVHRFLRALAMLALCCGSNAYADDAIVVQNLYYPKPGQEQAVLKTRLEASEVRRKLGLAVGRVLLRTSENDGQPYVLWECEYASLDARAKDSNAAEAAPAFRAVQEKMRTLIAKFDRTVWTVQKPAG